MPRSPFITLATNPPGSAALTFDLLPWHGPVDDFTRWELWEADVPVVPTAITIFGGRIIIQNGVGASLDRVRYTNKAPPVRFYPNHSLDSFDYTGPWT